MNRRGGAAAYRMGGKDMKFTDIAKIAKARKKAEIVTTTNDEQWLSVGAAAYKLEGLPKMDAKEFLRLAGVTDKKAENWVQVDREDESGIFSESGWNELELTADMAGLSIEYNSYILTPFYTMDGAVWVNVGYMVPVLAGKTEYMRFFLRRINGQNVIAIKDGLLLIALIAEFSMDRDFLEKIGLLYEQCKQRGAEEERREEYNTFSHTGSHTHGGFAAGAAAKGGYIVCERCGATLDHGEKCDCVKD